MDILLFYSVMLIICFSILCLSLYFTFKDKILKIRDWEVFIATVSIVFIFTNTISMEKEVSERMSIKLEKEFYTDYQYNDSIINDTILYNRLLQMRAPHSKIILCQAKIESANYKSQNYVRNFNLFGMKIPSSRVTVGYDGRAGYQNYQNWKESVTDYVLWQFSHNADKLSENEYLDYLSSVYAEDPNYVTKIRKMLNSIDFKRLEK